MNSNKVPDIIVSRLPVYLRALQFMAANGNTTTSSQELGEKVGISAAQIRKDLSQFGEFGKQGTGYHIPFLIDRLLQILKVERVWDVALVGMGELGHAILRYQGFVNRGFRIVACFDSDPSKIGTQVEVFTIENVDNLVVNLRKTEIKMAMLCVPAFAAQSVTDKLIEAGIKGILNYAPVSLSVPGDVRVQYIDPVIGLQRMAYYLSEK
ncbi:MAG: redox-sensing transcriptional repressor Rex [Chloroflexi bacterium]|nr:redox-sensing transcriptional repressor Rex [Chloroflexota bacterium]